jgi:hypothetical protein
MGEMVAFWRSSTDIPLEGLKKTFKTLISGVILLELLYRYSPGGTEEDPENTNIWNNQVGDTLQIFSWRD